ncbi:MAG: acylphosphatase [Cellulomonadaceae bacterium]|nr:acylphosphatase [Cellulomonadaceae bacterium]
MIRRRIIVQGSVQGVGFRWACQQEARRLGVHGSVFNRGDGGVEIVAEGAEPAVGAMVDWAHRGPRHAQVSTVDVTVEEPQGAVGFQVTG